MGGTDSKFEKVKMSQSATEANVITSQPLINSMNMAEPNPIQENEAQVIITQPMINDPDDVEKKKRQIDQTMQDITNNEVAEDCVWCCWTCTDFAYDVDCTGCCDDDCCGDCCTGCCDSGPSVDNVDGGDVAGCLDCCGSCCDSCDGCGD